MTVISSNPVQAANDIAAATDTDQSCFLKPAKASDEEISSFLNKPEVLLDENPAGGLPFSNSVRSIAGSSFKAGKAIIGLVAKSNSSQKAGIGAGLARVVSACSTANPEYATNIQSMVADLADTEVMTAFYAASKDIVTGSVPGVGIGGQGPGGGDVNDADTRGARNGNRFGGNETRANEANSFSVGNFGNSISDDVSPTVLRF